MAKQASTTSILTFVLKHGLGIAVAMELESALQEKPRNTARVRSAAVALIAAEVPNVNTKNVRLKAAIVELGDALAEASAATPTTPLKP